MNILYTWNLRNINAILLLLLLYPYRRLRNSKGIKGTRQKAVVTNNLSTIGENQLLTVRFSNLGKDDVIVPSSARLAFNISLQSTEDANRTIVHNIGRAIIKKISIKIEGNEVYSLDDADVYNTFKDLWLIKRQLENFAYQGIESDNITKLRIGAGDAVTDANNGKDKAIADAFGKQILRSARLLTFNGPSTVLSSRAGQSIELRTHV